MTPNASLVHADVFFFISTIAFVVIGLGICVALFYIIRILRDASFVSKKIKEESTEIISDLRKLREGFKEEGLKWKHVSDMIRNFFRFREAESSKSLNISRKKHSKKHNDGVISRIFR